MLYALGPGNPRTKDISYLIQRTHEKSAVYISLLEAHKEDALIKDVKINRKGYHIYITVNEKTGRERVFDFLESNK